MLPLHLYYSCVYDQLCLSIVELVRKIYCIMLFPTVCMVILFFIRQFFTCLFGKEGMQYIVQLMEFIMWYILNWHWFFPWMATAHACHRLYVLLINNIHKFIRVQACNVAWLSSTDDTQCMLWPVSRRYSWNVEKGQESNTKLRRRDSGCETDFF